MDGYGMVYGIWGILGLILWVLVIIGLILLIRYLWEGGRFKRDDSALEILKKKYARG